jgi:hypothetical protein
MVVPKFLYKFSNVNKLTIKIPGKQQIAKKPKSLILRLNLTISIDKISKLIKTRIQMMMIIFFDSTETNLIGLQININIYY